MKYPKINYLISKSLIENDTVFLNKELKASNNRDINKTKLLIARIKAKCIDIVKKKENRP